MIVGTFTRSLLSHFLHILSPKFHIWYDQQHESYDMTNNIQNPRHVNHQLIKILMNNAPGQGKTSAKLWIFK